MMSLNFQAEKHEKMLIERSKRCTVRLGDVSDKYPEGSIVWITAGKFNITHGASLTIMWPA